MVSRMSNFTEERIELMDKVYNHLIDHMITHSDRANPCQNLYSKRFSINLDLSQWVINEVAKLGAKLNILIAQRHGNGSYSIVRMLTIDALDFQSNGGFSNYFRDIKTSESLSNSIVNIYNNGHDNITTVGNDNEVIKDINGGI